MSNTYTILLFYKYVNVDDPESLQDKQRKLCEKLGITGRIIVSHEGINATVEGATGAVEEYIEVLTADERFSDVVFKKSEGTGDAFPRLSVKVRPELVSLHLGEEDVNPNRTTGEYLPAEKLHEWLHSDDEVHIVDMRNDYEYRIGHFKGSHLLPMRNFRDLPEVLEEIENLKEKKVVAVCTGGIRCEKATGFLKKKGFKNIYQLEDGIVTYMEKYPNEDFAGKLYVFDGRVAMGFETDSDEHEIVSRCEKCDEACDVYRDCAEPSCYPQYICCDACYSSEEGRHCSKACLQENKSGATSAVS